MTQEDVQLVKDRFGDEYIVGIKLVTFVMSITWNMDPVRQLRQDIQQFAWTRGWNLGRVETMVQDAIMSDMCKLGKWVCIKFKAYPKSPTPGYDADGREVWEYP